MKVLAGFGVRDSLGLWRNSFFFRGYLEVFSSGCSRHRLQEILKTYWGFSVQ